jgi:hypothetical protein
MRLHVCQGVGAGGGCPLPRKARKL